MDAADQLAAEERLARWMGVEPVVSWAVGTEDAYCLWDLGLKEAMDWVNSHEKYCIEKGYGVRRCERWPSYLTDANAWAPVHAEIARRGLADKFATEICQVVCGHPAPPTWGDMALLLTTTPAQRLAAMMRVIEGEENG